MPRSSGAPLRRGVVPALALSVLLFAGGGATHATGTSPQPAKPWGGKAPNPDTPLRKERPAGPATRLAVPIRPTGPVRPAGAGASGPPTEWTLTFHDEFDGSSLDRSKWRSGFGWGPANRSDYGWCDPDDNVVGGGVLSQRIERHRRGPKPWSVGCINSKHRFAQLYGYWEARIRTAGCTGARSAFWGKPDNETWPPEIDVVEVNGNEPETAKLTVHWAADGRHLESGGRRSGPDLSAGFHTFGVEWSPGGLTWFVDGVERRHTTDGAGALDDGGAFYTILNSQVIDAVSDCGDSPSDSAQYVDWVRIWTPAAPPPVQPPVPPQRPVPPVSSPSRGGTCGGPVEVRGNAPLPPGISEASGAVASQRFPGLGWLIRDSGNPASLFAFRFDGTGRPRVREVPVTGATNRDWEDLAYVLGPDGRGRLLIVESGQGGGDRFIYEVPEPDPDQAATAPARRYRYEYPDGPANTESAFMVGSHLALVTKTAPGRIYRFDRLSTAGVNRPRPMGALADADRVSVVRLSPDRRTLVAVAHTKALIYEGLPPATPIRGVVGRRPDRITGVDRTGNVEAGDWFPAGGCRLLLLAENRSTYQLRLTASRRAALRTQAAAAVD